MPFISMNLDDATEAKPVSAGRYDLVVASCEEALTKNEQKPQFKLIINIEGHDDAPPIFHYVGIPSESDEPDKAKFKALLLRRFLKLFGVKYDPAGFDTEQLAMQLTGARASSVELRQKEYNGNISNEMIVPPLKAEEGPQHAGKGSGKPPKRG